MLHAWRGTEAGLHCLARVDRPCVMVELGGDRAGRRSDLRSAPWCHRFVMSKALNDPSIQLSNRSLGCACCRTTVLPATPSYQPDNRANRHPGCLALILNGGIASLLGRDDLQHKTSPSVVVVHALGQPPHIMALDVTTSTPSSTYKHIYTFTLYTAVK